jgi:hypothetical protein
MAKTHYQRNCLSKAKGQPVSRPKIQFFKVKMYRGKPPSLSIYPSECLTADDMLGLGVSMARSCVINTIFFSSFEWMKKQINNLPDRVDADPVQ